MNPLDAFRQIVSNGYLSAPVFVFQGHKQYIGFLDTRNLVAWVVFAYDEQNTRPSLDEIVNHGIKRVSVAIDSVTVSYLARSNPFKAVSSDEKLLRAFEVLCARDCHRVPVLGEDGNVKKLITQYGVIEYLYKNRDQYPIALAHTVSFFRFFENLKFDFFFLYLGWRIEYWIGSGSYCFFAYAYD